MGSVFYYFCLFSYPWAVHLNCYDFIVIWISSEANLALLVSFLKTVLAIHSHLHFHVNSAISFSFFFLLRFQLCCILYRNQRGKLYIFKVMIICCMNKVCFSIWLSFLLIVLWFPRLFKLFSIVGDIANSISFRYVKQYFQVNNTQLSLLVMYLFTYLLLISSCSQ